MSVETSPLYVAAHPILTDADPRLREAAAPLAALDDAAVRDAAALCATLADFRRRHGYGRAIAAPQIGIARRMIAIDLGAGPFVVANPEITWRSEETFEVWDDCFSVPDQLARVRRHRSISLDYRDLKFRRRRWERLPPDLAELLQHEIDHLDGVLMTDRAVGADAVRPMSERSKLVDAQRPAHRLSLERIRDAARRIDPVFLHSPQFVSAPLSRDLGCTLTLKIETINPIRSFKGRGADYFVARRVDRADRRALICASAGNFGQALAYAGAKYDIPVVVFAARNANTLKIERMRALGADVRLEGDDFDGAKAAARRLAQANGSELIEDGLMHEISEGAGTLAIELLARDDVFDTVLVPLGNGALLNGMARWIKAASPSTRVVGVVSAGATAMADSWHRNAIVEHAQTQTIADGIAVRVPIPAAVDDMRGLVDDVVAVDDAALIEAMRRAHTHHGVVIEPAGAAGLAALIANPAAYAQQRVATVLAGGNLTAQQVRTWLAA